MEEHRFTLTLPEEIMNQIRQKADSRGLSMKELTRQYFKLGLLVMAIDEDPLCEIVVRKKREANSSVGVEETRLQFMW